ncbi:MAG: DNRLRE domain-containing protein, partial [Gammaproteobacteria bacterium]|nr:DNRLRE domain-containing protein [Gammaproteobacteria bacterium]
SLPPTVTATASSTSLPPTATASPTADPNGQTAIFNPEADAFTISSRPNGNLGGASTLRIDASPETNSYLRFNVQGVSGAVTQATLRLYMQSTSSLGYSVHEVADNSWGELTINGGNAPALGNVINSAGSTTANNFVDVDVTGYVTGDGLISFGLSTADSSLILVSSRESGNMPELVIEYGGGGGPTETPTSTATNTPVGPTPTFTNTPTATNTPSGGGSTFTFTTSDDAIVLGNRSTTNYGLATILGTDDAPDILSFLKFNVAGLDGPVSTATLRVFVNSGTAAFDVAQVADNSWTQTGIVYNNAPAIGVVINGSGIVIGGWIEIDVTSAISGDGTFSLALLPSGIGRDLFSSSEGGNGPELVIETIFTPTLTPSNTPIIGSREPLLDSTPESVTE